MSILNRHPRFSSILSCLLCLLFLLQIINRTVYIHSHKLSNGIVITHAHPFNKTSDSAPFKNHHHSDQDFFLLAQLEILFLTALITISFLRAPFNLNIPIYFREKCHPAYILIKPGRAPPQ